MMIRSIALHSTRRCVVRAPVCSASRMAAWSSGRWNSTQTQTAPKQFKKFTLPTSQEPQAAATAHSTPELKSAEKTSKNTSFASHMDDLKNTKCINQLISDNNDMPLSLSITERASLKLQELIRADNNDKVALVIKVESGGCHGFQYDLRLSEDYERDFHPEEEETMFVRDGVARVVIDKTSLEILRDSKVDYVNELIGSQFKVVDSPYTSSSCGCGSSFDFDFDKLANEQNS